MPVISSGRSEPTPPTCKSHAQALPPPTCSCLFSVGAYNLSLYGSTVLQGLSPYWIGVWFINHGTEGWRMLGGVMLCVTGVEALFADLGHFSIPSIGVSPASPGRGCVVDGAPLIPANLASSRIFIFCNLTARLPLIFTWVWVCPWPSRMACC